MSRNRSFLVWLLLVAALAACGGQPPPAEPGVIATNTPAVIEQPTEAPPATAVPTEAPPATVPAAEPTAEPATAAPAVLCPDLPRPALIVSAGTGFEGYDPLSGARCPLPLPATLGYLQPGGDRLYFVNFDYDTSQSVVARLGTDGAIEPLEATRVTGDFHYMLRFAVDADDKRVAWGFMQAFADPAVPNLGTLQIGATDGSMPIPIFGNAEIPGATSNVGGRIVTPIRFTADGATLYFSWEPIGLGGMWASFNGRYDNLYRTTGGAPEKVFDCADTGLFLCIGDFMDDGTLATIDAARVIHVIGPDGAELAAIPTTAAYAGYPTFGPGGDLFYSEAGLPEGDSGMPLPSPGMVYSVAAPYTGAPALVATADGLLVSALPRPFLDAGHLLVSIAEGEQWGMGLLTPSGETTRLEPWPATQPVVVWPAD